jgi:hypothetical protein
MRGEQFAADHHSWMGSNLQSCAKMLDRSWKNDGFFIVNKKKSKANKIKHGKSTNKYSGISCHVCIPI